MALQPVEPGSQSGLVDGREAINGMGYLMKFGADPGDGLQDAGVLGAEIFPVDDALVVEDAVAQIANPLPPGIQLLQVALRSRRVREGQACESMTKPGASVGFVEETRPKSEVQFRHHPPGRDGFAFGQKFLAGLAQLPLLPDG